MAHGSYEVGRMPQISIHSTIMQIKIQIAIFLPASFTRNRLNQLSLMAERKSNCQNLYMDLQGKCRLKHNWEIFQCRLSRPFFQQTPLHNIFMLLFSFNLVCQLKIKIPMSCWSFKRNLIITKRAWDLLLDLLVIGSFEKFFLEFFLFFVKRRYVGKLRRNIFHIFFVWICIFPYFPYIFCLWYGQKCSARVFHK